MAHSPDAVLEHSFTPLQSTSLFHSAHSLPIVYPFHPFHPISPISPNDIATTTYTQSVRHRYYYHYCSTNHIHSDSSVFTSAFPYSSIFYPCCKRVGSYSVRGYCKPGAVAPGFTSPTVLATSRHYQIVPHAAIHCGLCPPAHLITPFGSMTLSGN